MFLNKAGLIIIRGGRGIIGKIMGYQAQGQWFETEPYHHNKKVFGGFFSEHYLK